MLLISLLLCYWREGNIRIDHQEVECRVVEWIKLAQDRDRWQAFVAAVMNR